MLKIEILLEEKKKKTGCVDGRWLTWGENKWDEDEENRKKERRREEKRSQLETKKKIAAAEKSTTLQELPPTKKEQQQPCSERGRGRGKSHLDRGLKCYYYIQLSLGYSELDASQSGIPVVDAVSHDTCLYHRYRTVLSLTVWYPNHVISRSG